MRPMIAAVAINSAIKAVRAHARAMYQLAADAHSPNRTPVTRACEPTGASTVSRTDMRASREKLTETAVSCFSILAELD
jgi:hypothetical protein